MEDIMSTHPNVAVIERMTQAIVENDRETLTRIFTDDMVFHGRGPIPFAGDHHGVDGLLAALGTVFETAPVTDARGGVIERVTAAGDLQMSNTAAQSAVG